MNGECDGANDGEGAETSDGSSSTTPAMMMLLEDLFCCSGTIVASRGATAINLCLCFAFNFCLLVVGRAVELSEKLCFVLLQRL